MLFVQGDGVPPSESRDFCEWLFAGKSGPLPNLHYSVCSLGDTTYTHFCRCGKQVDAALAAAGGAQLAPRVDVDKEDWPKVEAWISGVINNLAGVAHLQTFEDLGGVPAAAGVSSSTANSSSKKYSKSRPYYARVAAVEGLCVLTNADDKDTIRLELELGPEGLEAGGLAYQPGDALGIWPSNPPQVSRLLHVTVCCCYLYATDGSKYTQLSNYTKANSASAAAELSATAEQQETSVAGDCLHSAGPLHSAF